MADDKILDNEEFDDDAEYITLQFDDSEDIECEILGIFDFEEKEYIALLPQDGSDDVYIYEYSTSSTLKTTHCSNELQQNSNFYLSKKNNPSTKIAAHHTCKVKRG